MSDSSSSSLRDCGQDNCLYIDPNYGFLISFFLSELWSLLRCQFLMPGPLLTTSKSLLIQCLCTGLDYWVVNAENVYIVLCLRLWSELLLGCLLRRSAFCDSGCCHWSTHPAREWTWKEETTCLEASPKMDLLANSTSTPFMTMLWERIMSNDKDSCK